ncbi:MAG: hypothetical protein JST92_18830, partial [Deltaproteobacteria bacterium]|nr:hypothetical protein [Deltaproteobacteria bacterium]
KKDHPEAKDDKAKDGKDGKKHAEKGPFQWKSAFKAIRRGLWVPQTILVTFEDGTTERILWPADEKWHRWEFLRPSKIESAQLDPDNSVLMDINKFDDGKAREPNSKATRRWQLELGAWVEALLTIGGSL